MIISRCIHVAKNAGISFLLMAEEYSIVYMDHILLHSSVDGQLGCFHVLAIVNSAAVNIKVHGSSHHGSAAANLTRIHEDLGLIPGLTQWVKDPALP